MTLETVKYNILQLKLEEQAELMHFLVDWFAIADSSKRREQSLIHKIKYGGPPSDLYEKHDELLSKSVNGVLTVLENETLQQLVPIFDRWAVERTKLIIELANLWEITPLAVMKQLGIAPSSTIYE
ncbi:MAG: hypothetical protein AAGI49_16285 [Bacteroidota bacterium]